jgi:hypothetical protein
MYTVEDGVYRIQTDDGAPSAPSEADVWSNIVLANAKPSEILAALGRAQRWDGTKQAPASLIDGIQTIIPNDTGHDLIVSGTAESIAELRRLVHMLDGKPAATPAGAPSSGDPPKPDNAPPPSLQKPSPAWMKAYRAQTIYVDGAVNKPGRYALRCKCTLAAAIAIAGGLKPTAKQVLLNPESPPGNRPVVYTLGVWGSSAVLRKAVIFPGDEIVVAAVTAVR